MKDLTSCSVAWPFAVNSYGMRPSVLSLLPQSLARLRTRKETRPPPERRGVDIPQPRGEHLPVPAAPEDVLDNAVWHSLHSRHRALAEGTGRARRYPAELSVFG